jgi:multidrug efflux system membrane fusion protein
MLRRSLAIIVSSSLLLSVVLSGCQRRSGQIGAPEVPVIPVSKPVSRMITNHVDFTGRTDAKDVVDIRARVTGYLVRMPFREGAEVKAGDLLFEIDPRPYKAQLDQAQSQVKLNQASLKLAQATYERDRAIAATVAGGVSQQQLDQDRAAVDEALARVKASEASTEVYKLNLDFTKVRSPIDGQVSRYYLTHGNLVNIDQTLLTTIVSLEPMYAYFDMDEPTLLRIRQAIMDGRINLPEDGSMLVYMGLQGEEGYPHEGRIDFLNNQVNPTTGSITLRGVFKNHKTAKHVPALLLSTVGLLAAPFNQGPLLALPVPVPGMNQLGTRLLSPGMFVRIRLPIGTPRPRLLVIDRAIQSDQGIKYVYVVDSNNTVQYRRVTTRTLQPDGLRVVEGVKPDEWVVVGGLQQVRPLMKIQTEPRSMPTLSPHEEPSQTSPAKEPSAPAKQPSPANQ